MDNLMLDVLKIKTEVEDTKLKLDDYHDSLNKYLESVTKVDGCWNDVLTESFIKIVNEEKELFNEHFKTTEKYTNFILDFCDKFQLELNDILNTISLNKIQYYKSAVNNSLNCLNIINKEIKEIEAVYNSISIPYGCVANYDIASILDGIKYDDVNEVNKKIEDTINKITKFINEEKDEINNIDFINIDDSVCELVDNSNNN